MNVAERVRQLNLPPDQFVVVGGAVLEVLGIRASDDIDITASEVILQKLASDSDWSRKDFEDGDYVYQKDDYEIGGKWLERSFAELVSDTFEMDGIRYVSLATVMAWKKQRNRPKDQADIKLIWEYLS